MGRPCSCLLAILLCVSVLTAEHRGVVKFGTLPVSGATVTAKQGEKTAIAITEADGTYVIPEATEGVWQVKVEMRGFAAQERQVQGGTLANPAPPAEWSLTMLPFAEITARPEPPQVRVAEAPKVEIKRPENVNAPAPTNTTSSFQNTQVQANANAQVANADVSADVAQRANDGFLVNGSVNNAASSPFSTLPAFGNNRGPTRWPYNGNIGLIMNNSALDARPYSLTGQNTPRPGYNRVTGTITLGGPIRIPGLLRNGPQFTLNYQWTRNRNVSTQSALMPTAMERLGDFSQTLTPLGQPVVIRDPITGNLVPGNRIPVNGISPQAQALLRLFPLPNFTDEARYNYQIPIINNVHQDNVQFRTNRTIGRRDNLVGTLATASSRSDRPDIYGFLSNGRNFNLNSTINWRHTFSTQFYLGFTYTFARGTNRNIPFFANRENISGLAGITGNNQEPVNWGPPTLNFANGIAAMGEQQYSSSANVTQGIGIDGFRARGRHNFTFGYTYRRLQVNQISQQDARGTFGFTANNPAGHDFAGFLYGLPDTASIAFGNADKYFRSNQMEAFLNDDWRFRSGLSINLGLRWDYNSPVTEKYGRLVNMDIGGFFATATPLVARDAAGRLIEPDRNNFSPRIGFAWRPFPASSMVVRGGYGIAYDTSQYQQIATQMAQQAPLSTSLRVTRSADNPLTLANGFRGSPNITPTTFAIDPRFRTGYAQTWQLQISRDLPFALQMVATYQAIKGTRGVQQFLPNTFPNGVENPCITCPSGFSYMTSNGNSIRHAGIIQMRRRLRRGFTSEVTYTYAKSIDNAALGGNGFLIAQNWLDLRSERARSNFDQRHTLGWTFQYTTGATSGLAFLMTGPAGAYFRDWTFASQLNYATGTPLTPTYVAAVRGTGVTNSLRANYVGGDPYDAPPGLFLNPAAYAPPAEGEWGNAGRNTITGPSQFTWNASVGRSFRWNDRFFADLRVDATNLLNHPVFTSWISNITSAQFGFPNPPNQMRSVQTSLRVRF